MHILLIHQVFVRPQDPGGTRHYDFSRLLVDKGHRVTVLAGTRSYLSGELLPAERLEEPVPGLQIIRCGVIGGPRGRRSAAAASSGDGKAGLGTQAHGGPRFAWRTVGYFSFVFSSLWNGLRTRNVDVVWGTTPPLFQAWTAWLVAWLKRRPWLLEVRDLWPDFAVEVGALQNPALISLSRWLERFLYRHADQIVVNSPGFASHIKRVVGTLPEISFIPNGVDLQWIAPPLGNSAAVASSGGSMLREPHGLQGKFIALYSGAHGMANDLSQILDAAQELREDPRIVIALVGDGAEKAALQQQANAMELANLLFLPPVEQAHMLELMAEADCGLAVLRAIPMFTTTYPNKVFDYMAAGLPVVLAIDGEIRKVVDAADAGVFARPGDGPEIGRLIRSLADDPGRAHKMGRNGRATIQREYDRSHLAAEMMDVFLSLAMTE